MQQSTVYRLSIALLIALLVYGVYAMLSFLGAPLHASVLLTGEKVNLLKETCSTGSNLCRGFVGFIPFLSYLFARLEPFYGYIVMSALIYAGVIGWRFVMHHETDIEFRFRPYHVLLLFVASMWLLFTSISYTSVNSVPITRFIEPDASVYTNVGTEGLQVLEKNFTDLKEAGCLRQTTETFNGVSVYQLGFFCAQGSFFKRVLGPLFLLLFLLLDFLILGRVFLQLIRLKMSDPLVEGSVSLGLGAFFMTAILWTLGVLSYHVESLSLYTSFSGWLLLGAIPIIGYQQTFYWYEKLKDSSWDVRHKWWDPHLFLVWFLITYLALNYITVIRPFPIGWDDLGSYLNRPRLLVSYGHFVFSMAQFQWEYLTSFGYLLFGYDNPIGATISMLINWMAGFLAVFTVYVFGHTFIGKGRGVLAATLYYTLPMVGHFSFADMKVDNAVFTMGALSVLAAFIALFSLDHEQANERRKWFLVAGLLGAFAFAIKATSVMVLMAIGAVMLGVLLHSAAFVGAFLFSIFLLYMQQVIPFDAIVERIAGETVFFSETTFFMVTFLLGASFLGYGCYHGRRHLRETCVLVAVFAASFIVAIAPWVTHNNILHQNSLFSLTMGAPNTFAPITDYRGVFEDGRNRYTVRRLPEEIALDPTHETCVASGSAEELDRYWGFRKGWSHYLTLPWRIFMNADSGGYYVTLASVLSLFPLLLLLPALWRKESRWMRWLWVATLYMLVQWMFLANGIIWYGVGMFLGFAVLLEALLSSSPTKATRITTFVLVVLSLLMALAMRVWQFETQRNLFEYPLGKASAGVMLERTVPHYNDIATLVIDRKEQIPDRPYLYRVGTFIPYFIPKNLEVIGRIDHQLDAFNCMYQERDPALTTERLKALGFNAIIFDTNTATIERDPNGSLHQKVDAFVQYANNPESNLQVVLSDPAAGVAFILIP